ncbi:MAG: sugar phosphate isomerase/epimerase family protein [Candidatus Ratteibacteria bacterium]
MRLIEISEILDSPSILTIPGAVDTSLLSQEPEIIDYKKAYERVKEAIGDLILIAEKKKKVLVLENVPNKIFLSPLEFRDLIDSFKSEYIGCQFDIGNSLALQGYPEQWIRILGKRIKAVHLKDYRIGIGNYFESVANIFEGDVNWKEVCKALAEIDYKGPLICEVLPPYKYYPEHLYQTALFAISLLEKEIENYKKLKV